MKQTPQTVAPDRGGTDDLVQGESGIVKTTFPPWWLVRRGGSS
jgi:hypothetical protein